jgi:hypothetical protein
MLGAPEPIIPATQYVDIKSLPELISAHQARKLETLQSRTLLVEDVKQLCDVVEDDQEDEGGDDA